MGRSSARCPKCGRKVKYLFENEYDVAISKAGKNMVRYKGVKRALYCVVCKEVYSLDLEKHLEDIRKNAEQQAQDLYEQMKI